MTLASTSGNARLFDASTYYKPALRVTVLYCTFPLRMKKNVSKAKRKIEQQRDCIQLLKVRLERGGSEKPVFNKTAVSLFGNSPLVSIETSTPSEQLIHQSIHNYEPSFSSTTSFGFCETRNEADTDSESTDISVEEVITYNDDVIRIEVGSPDHSGGITDQQPHTCVSLFDTSIKTSPRKPLQLRRPPTNRVKYREATYNTSGESVSSTSYEGHTPSVLKETTELPSPECLSPRFLGPTPYHSPYLGTESLPLFHSTTKPNIDTSKLVTPPPTGNQTTNLIPISDSQYSLDVSQSCPPSPELCGGGSGSFQHTKSSSNQQHIEVSTRKDDRLFPTTLPQTPSIVTQATIIPITPGITTVKTILGRTVNDTNFGSFGISKGSKRQVPHEIEETLPARKKQHHPEERSDNEVGSKVVVTEQRKHISNEEDDKV